MPKPKTLTALIAGTVVAILQYASTLLIAGEPVSFGVTVGKFISIAITTGLVTRLSNELVAKLPLDQDKAPL